MQSYLLVFKHLYFNKIHIITTPEAMIYISIFEFKKEL